MFRRISNRARVSVASIWFDASKFNVLQWSRSTRTEYKLSSLAYPLPQPSHWEYPEKTMVGTVGSAARTYPMMRNPNSWICCWYNLRVACSPASFMPRRRSSKRCIGSELPAIAALKGRNLGQKGAAGIACYGYATVRMCDFCNEILC